MLTESALMSSAAEVRFRVQAPNSKPRAIKVVALDKTGDEVVKRLAAGPWDHATFLTASSVGGAPISDRGVAGDGWLTDVAGRPRNLHDEVDTADLVVMVAGPGGEAQMATIIGERCSLKRINTTGLIVGASRAAYGAVSKTLAQLRPWSLMVVIAESDDYIDDMLIALRAE